MKILKNTTKTTKIQLKTIIVTQKYKILQKQHKNNTKTKQNRIKMRNASLLGIYVNFGTKKS